MTTNFVSVALFAPLKEPFHYHWPETLGTATTGMRVKVPLGNSQRLGVVVELYSQQPDENTKFRDVLDVLDSQPLYNPLRQQWLQRMIHYYLSSAGQMWESALSWANSEDTQRFRPLDNDQLQQQFPDLNQAFVRNLPLSLKTLRQRCTSPNLHMQIRQATRNQWLERIQPKATWLADLADLTANSALPVLNPEQDSAVQYIRSCAKSFNPILLFGRTGSGKTEVYLEAAKSFVEQGLQVLILVPEIGLTPMWQSRIKQRFSRTLVWHSALSPQQRLATISHLQQAEIVIGTRSAIFLPLTRIGLIVIDEEHDNSFKQQETPCYSARDAALMLAQQLEIPLVLGSATPSLESWHQVKQGRYHQLILTQQAASTNQKVDLCVVDMCQHKEVVSPPLLQALHQTKQRNEQAILFLNRRGYAPALQCTACGDVSHCPACSLRLTIHRYDGELRCHVCGFFRRVPRCCEQCGEQALLPMGAGTERLDESLKESLPELSFARFDRDMVTSHQRLVTILERFEQGEIDCLIGTQMLVKGHDFPNVTLVGVIHADMGLSVPDFRASERWWQQMTQVMGRAGRGKKTGRVLMQSWMPEAPWLTRIHQQSASETLDQELALRQQLQFPPFARWVRIVCSANKKAVVMDASQKIAHACQQIPGIKVMPAMPCSLERQANRYRFEVLLRDADKTNLPWKLKPILDRLRLPSTIRCRVDVDPIDMG